MITNIFKKASLLSGMKCFTIINIGDKYFNFQEMLGKKQISRSIFNQQHKTYREKTNFSSIFSMNLLDTIQQHVPRYPSQLIVDCKVTGFLK